MFSLSSNIDTQKAFLKKRSELEGRIDVMFYLNSFDYTNCIKLSKIAKVKGGKRIPLGYDYSHNETPFLYLRVANMDESNEFKFSDFKFISEEIFTILERYEVFENDLIISIAGSVGKIKLLKNIPIDKRIILTENCANIVIKNKENLLPEYLSIVLQTDFIKNQINLSYIQTTIPKLGIDKILDLKIPSIPNIDFQHNVISIYKNSFNLKQSKENQAIELLKNIDLYLLRELGITLPVKDSSYSNRTFEVKWSEISGDRFDAFSFFNSAIKIEGGIYENKKLRELATVNKGQSITSSNVIAGEYPVIAGGKTSPYSHNEYNYDGKTITVSASGAYSGYVWYHNEPIFASDCAVIRSKDENIITMDYLSEILKLKQTEIYGLQQGAGQPHVYPSDLIKLNIPVPPIDIQERITTHIFELREKAKQLEIEAKEVLDNAKKEIEKMIIGQ
jgi:restriction endonuclease S subunit